MSTDIDKLRQIKGQILDLVAEYTVNPKPSYSLDGQSVNWTDWFQAMMARVREIDEMIAETEPFEFHTQAKT